MFCTCLLNELVRVENRAWCLLWLLLLFWLCWKIFTANAEPSPFWFLRGLWQCFSVKRPSVHWGMDGCWVHSGKSEFLRSTDPVFLSPSVSLPCNFLSSCLGVLSWGEINVLAQWIFKTLWPLSFVTWGNFFISVLSSPSRSQGRAALNMGMTWWILWTIHWHHTNIWDS